MSRVKQQLAERWVEKDRLRQVFNRVYRAQAAQKVVADRSEAGLLPGAGEALNSGYLEEGFIQKLLKMNQSIKFENAKKDSLHSYPGFSFPYREGAEFL